MKEKRILVLGGKGGNRPRRGTEVLDGRNATVTSDIEKVLDRKATDFSEFVKANARVRTQVAPSEEMQASGNSN